MAESLGGAIRAWDNNATPPAAGNLGAALAAAPHGAMPAVKRANLLRIWITLGGNNCTGIDAQLVPAMRRRTAVAGHLPALQVDTVAGGLVIENTSTVRRDFALGTPVVCLEFLITPDTAYVLWLASRGSAGVTTAIATAEFYSV